MDHNFGSAFARQRSRHSINSLAGKLALSVRCRPPGMNLTAMVLTCAPGSECHDRHEIRSTRRSSRKQIFDCENCRQLLYRYADRLDETKRAEEWESKFLVCWVGGGLARSQFRILRICENSDQDIQLRCVRTKLFSFVRPVLMLITPTRQRDFPLEHAIDDYEIHHS